MGVIAIPMADDPGIRLENDGIAIGQGGLKVGRYLVTDEVVCRMAFLKETVCSVQGGWFVNSATCLANAGRQAQSTGAAMTLPIRSMLAVTLIELMAFLLKNGETPAPWGRVSPWGGRCGR